MFLNLLFAMRVANDMSCALEKIIMMDVSGYTQSWISRISGNITVFAKIFISSLDDIAYDN